jgi:hypothetical protein
MSTGAMNVSFFIMLSEFYKGVSVSFGQFLVLRGTLTQLVKHAPEQLLLHETPKGSINISSGSAIYDKDVIGWRRVYQVCHIYHTDCVDSSFSWCIEIGDRYKQ